jgi:hypothetical protein
MPSSLANVDFDPAQRFRELAALWNAREFEQVTEAFGDDSVFTPDPLWPEPGPFTGRQARAELLRVAAAWETLVLEIHSIETVGDTVLADVRWIARGVASGADVLQDFWFVCRFADDGSFRTLHAFFEERNARAEAGIG